MTKIRTGGKLERLIPVNDAEGPMVSIKNFLSCQVCVPDDYTDEQSIDFLESEYPCGTIHGWQADMEQPAVQCKERTGYKHIILLA